MHKLPFNLLQVTTVFFSPTNFFPTMPGKCVCPFISHHWAASMPWPKSCRGNEVATCSAAYSSIASKQIRSQARFGKSGVTHGP